jgi:hypothetical protein
MLCYKTLTQFSRQSPSLTPETVMTMAPSAAKPIFQGTNLSDSSDEDTYVEICTRKKTRPNPLVYTHRQVNQDEDLALSSDSSDEELDQAAREI